MAALADGAKQVSDSFEENRAEFAQLSSKIWKNPERSYQEHRAMDVLCTFLEKGGFDVERKFVSATGFKASYKKSENSSGDADKGLNICFICDYDAVADLGHAAGHNLQSTGSIAAAIAIKKCIEKDFVKGQVTVLGTPGDDCGHGSKIDMLNAGIFHDIDICLMFTPFNQDILYPNHYNLVVVDVTYTGKASHASAAPWEGRNALDAAVACYNNVALLRQQLKPQWSINGIIKEGGIQPNVVPQTAQLQFWLRAPEQPDLVLLQLKCQGCFVAAAKATGCEANFEFEDKPNYAVKHNSTLGEVFQHQAQKLDIAFSEDPCITEPHIGSTDMGNVSQVIPTINPAIDIGTSAPLHSEAFTEASGGDEALDNILRASKALAMTACEVMADPRLGEYIRTENVKLEEGTSGGRVRAWSFSDER